MSIQGTGNDGGWLSRLPFPGKKAMEDELKRLRARVAELEKQLAAKSALPGGRATTGGGVRLQAAWSSTACVPPAVSHSGTGDFVNGMLVGNLLTQPSNAAMHATAVLPLSPTVPVVPPPTTPDPEPVVTFPPPEPDTTWGSSGMGADWSSPPPPSPPPSYDSGGGGGWDGGGSGSSFDSGGGGGSDW